MKPETLTHDGSNPKLLLVRPQAHDDAGSSSSAVSETYAKHDGGTNGQDGSGTGGKDGSGTGGQDDAQQVLLRRMASSIYSFGSQITRALSFEAYSADWKSKTATAILSGRSPRLARDIQNFDRNNVSEQAVLESGTFSWYRGVPVVRMKCIDGRSFYFGVIVLDTDEKDPEIIKHEWGHMPQFKLLGPALYLLYIGIPSIFHSPPKTEAFADYVGGVINSRFTPEEVQESIEYLNTRVWT
jgi:hypothetical protein